MGFLKSLLTRAGLEVILNDIAEEFVEKGFRNISQNLDRLVAKSVITAEKKEEILRASRICRSRF